MPVNDKALRIGAITAAVIGTVAIPATAFAASAPGHSILAGATSAIHQQVDGQTEDYAGPADRGPRPGGANFAKLATALNTTPDKLEAAMKAAREETKPATKPATDAERDAQRAKYEAALAAKLGVTVDQLKAALEANKPAKPTAAEMKAMIQPRLTQMVSKGTITQAQADQILADIDAGKPVFEVLRQFMPQLGDDHKGPGQGGEHRRGPGAQGQQGQQGQGVPGARGQQGPRA